MAECGRRFAIIILELNLSILIPLAMEMDSYLKIFAMASFLMCCLMCLNIAIGWEF